MSGSLFKIVSRRSVCASVALIEAFLRQRQVNKQFRTV